MLGVRLPLTPPNEGQEGQMGKVAYLLVAVAGLMLSGCGYNSIQSLDEHFALAFGQRG